MSQFRFKGIANHARLPRAFLQVLDRSTAIHIKATPTILGSAGSDEYISEYNGQLTCIYRVSFTCTVTGFILYSNMRTAMYFAAAFTFHTRSHTMYAFIHGLRPGQM